MGNNTTAPCTTTTPCFTAPHITETPCTTETPYNITEIPPTEESPGYTQFLQNYEAQLNNIMNPSNVCSNEALDWPPYPHE